MYCWGDGSAGKLALHLQSPSTVVAIPTEALSFPEPVSQVASGEHHTLILTATGKIWTCGRNSSGQLGRRKNKNKMPVHLDDLGPVVGVACGQEHSLALCKSGQVFAWGRGSDGQLGTGSTQKHQKPTQIYAAVSPSLPTSIAQVACGNHHSLAITKGGDMFSWGHNNRGQLGLGREFSTQAVPSQVLSLTGEPVIKVCAGGEYSLALSLSGTIYCCGANQVGQLGLNRVDANGRFKFCAVPALRALNVSDISCGEAHTVVLTEDGAVFTFGEGKYGQLGHISTENELKPRKVESLNGHAKQIACGSHHTLVLMSSGLLLAFGSGLKGQLGIGQTENQLQPAPVQQTWRPPGASANTDMKISAGWNRSFIHYAPPEESGEHICKNFQKQLTLNPGNNDLGDAERNLTYIFSSNSALVASFTRMRESPSNCPISVDLQAARRTFECLQGDRWMNAAQKLIANLSLASKFMRSVNIFLILPEWHLFHNEQNVIPLVLPLARSIVSLPESSVKQLRDHWTSLELELFTKHISLWTRALSFLLKACLLLHFSSDVKDMLEILKQMHKANKNRKACQSAPETEFHLVDLDLFPRLLYNDLQQWRSWRSQENTLQTSAIFCRFPFVLTLPSKIYIFYCAVALSKELHQLLLINKTGGRPLDMWPSDIPPCPLFKLRIRRSALIEDTFRQLGITDHDDFKKELVVKFVERGDPDVTLLDRTDFFHHIFKKLFLHESQMFLYNDSETLVWFPVKPAHPMKRYFLFGILCGLAIYSNNTVYLPFPKVLFKKLLNVKATLEDLIEFSPILGKALKNILGDSDVEDPEQTFSVSWDGVDVELDPNEKGKPVTNANKHDFVKSYVDYILNKSVENIFEEFKRGFFTVCDKDVVELFQPHELMELLVGIEDYDWETLKRNTVYEGEYHENHPNIIMFWEVFEELTQNEKKAFFLFLTGSERVPILGMDVIKMRVHGLSTLTEVHAPVALVCHKLLQLPIYKTKEKMKVKLLESINHDKDFWKNLVQDGRL